MAAALKIEDIMTGPYTWESIQPCDLSKCTKRQILEYFENTFSLSESVFAVLKTRDAFYLTPDRLRLPLIFYYAHTASVYVNKLLLAGLIKERVNFVFETMFETGVDEMSWDDTENYRMGSSYKWPDLEEVVAYRLEVRSMIRKVIEDTPLKLPVTQESPWWAIFMGFEHERVHVETSSVLIRQLPISMVKRPKDWVPGPLTYGESPLENPFLTVEEMEVVMGKPCDFPSYGWDNEYPTLQVSVPRFEATKYLITNREFHDFMKAGGYQRKDLWSQEGWKWRSYCQAIHPTFWVCNQECKSGCGGSLCSYSHCKPDKNENKIAEDGSGFRYRSLCEETPMPWDWPAEVNYHEAKTYAAWKGPDYRLLTEAEHHAMRDTRGPLSDIIYQADLHQRFNTNLAYGSSTPVNMYPPNKKGFYDVFGNVWQWTEDHFNGLPGSESHFLYDDFSTPTFDGKHNVIMGGSWISTGDGTSVFARYAFRRHFFQHAGFRLARSLAPAGDIAVRLVKPIGQQEEEDIYLPIKDIAKMEHTTTNDQLLMEMQTNVDNRLFDEYHVGELCLALVLARVGIDAAQRHGANLNRALDVGCGCGRLAFELSSEFDEVVGLDYCGMFVEAAREVLANKQKLFYCPKDDCQHSFKRPKRSLVHDGCALVAKLPEGVVQSKIILKQFTWIPNELSGFDLVVHHCLERVSNKRAWLVRLWEILSPGGIVVISGLGGWTREKLQPLIGNNLKFIESLPMKYAIDDCSTELDSETIATVWHLKN